MQERWGMVRGLRIRFLIYADDGPPDGHMDAFLRVFSRLPNHHVACIPPIVIMRLKPGGRDGGGTWTPSEWRRDFSGERQQVNTGIDFADLEARLAGHHGGLIGMSLDRWQRNTTSTIMHEVGHCVNNEFGLVPRGAGPDDWPGMMTNRCHGGNDNVKRAVEAYARRYCSPAEIFHQRVGTMTPQDQNAALIATLDRSPAYNVDRTVAH